MPSPEQDPGEGESTKGKEPPCQPLASNGPSPRNPVQELQRCSAVWVEASGLKCRQGSGAKHWEGAQHGVLQE